MKGKATEFMPQFGRSQVHSLECRYLADERGKEKEQRAFAAGERIRKGDYSREQLKIIYDWKTGGRGKGRLAKNSDAEISDALRLAVAARQNAQPLPFLRPPGCRCTCGVGGADGNRSEALYGH